MKGEITSIRDQLDLLGPTLTINAEKEEGEDDEEEDCSVEDVIALSSVCLEDGYIEERDGNVDNDDGGGASLEKEDTTLLLKDLLPPPPPTTTTTTTAKEEEQTKSTTKQKPRTNTIPSGIPVYHVNTNKFPQVGAKNHIAGLPTLVLFYRGEELWRNEGLMRGEEILSVLTELQLGGWKKKTETKKTEKSGGDGTKEVDAVVVHGEEVDKKKKKRKGRRLGG